jgi:Sulfotransferase domain
LITVGISTNETSRLPDFIAVGPPRTGTTWLDQVLRGHVNLPLIKETHFFAYNHHLGLDWYRSYFRDCSPELPTGEIAPTYFDHAEARERIASIIPRCRIICSLRDPVARAYSHYKVWSRAGLVEGPFDYAAQAGQLGATASYASNLRAWQKTFGADNVLVVLYDDLRANPQLYLDSICGFIGIARFDLSKSPGADGPINRSERMPRSPMLARHIRRLRPTLIRWQRWRLVRLLQPRSPLWNFFFAGGDLYPPLDAKVEASIRELLRPDIEELEMLLDRDLSAWKLPPAERAGRIAARI